MEKFTSPKELGCGSYGNVFSVNYRSSKYALKIITGPLDRGIISLREIDIMKRIVHPNLTYITHLWTEILPKRFKYMFTMPIAKYDLYSLLRDEKWTTEMRISALSQITDGVRALHKYNILHLDLKAENILMFKDNRIKITDFGLSLYAPNGWLKYPKKLVTINHRSPELLKGQYVYGPWTDIWSLGIVFVEILSGQKAINYTAKKWVDKKVLKIVKQKFGLKNIESSLEYFFKDLNLKYKGEMIYLVKRMLKFNRRHRISAESILQSTTFRKYKSFSARQVRYPIPKTYWSGIENWYVFDDLIRICTDLPISLRTFFLSVDIYYRTVYFMKEKSYINLLKIMVTSLYMAIKLNESFYWCPLKIEKLVNIKPEEIIYLESSIVKRLRGILYSKNMFTESTTLGRVLWAFKISRNPVLYPKIDLSEWKKLDLEESKSETQKFDRDILFVEFLPYTGYNEYLDKDRNIYLPKIQKEDLKI